MIFLVGFAGAFCVLISRLIMGSNPALIAIIVTILACLALLIFICNHYHAYRFGTWVAVITISEFLFPLAFFFLGGANSSIAAYFILSIVVVAFLLQGKSMVIMMVIHMALITSCYVIGALYPSLVMSDLTDLQRIEDGIFSVLILGSVVAAIIKFQKAIFDEERVKNIQTSETLSSTLNEVSKQDELLQIRLQQQQLMSNIAQSFISNRPMKVLIQDALGQVSEFLEATRALIGVADKVTHQSYPVYNWAKSEEWIPAPVKTGFNEIINNTFPFKIPESGYVEPISCNNIKKDYGGKYSIFETADLKSFIWMPIYVEGYYWGMLSIEECERYRTWNESDRQLVGSVASAISGAVSRDIKEKDRQIALQEAIEASKAKGDFLSNMSHEMRTPMNAIIGMTSIGMSAQSIDRKDYAFEKIEDASNHLLGVINDILDMSKIEAGKLELNYSTFDFRQMLNRVVDVIYFKVEERRQSFQVDIDPKIPDLLYGDDQRLAQVITNLLSNAVKFTPEDGKISLEASFQGQDQGLYRLKIAVADTGIGISDEQKERLFNPFEQAETGTQRKFGGTGLGLVISKRIVEMMDGDIWIDSKLGNGSTFSFNFAIKGPSEQEQQQFDSTEHDAETDTDDFSDYHVLLAEDVPINQEIVLALLEPTGLKISCADNGAIALQKFKENPESYDAILMDVQMPEMDGYTAASSIRALDIPQAKQIPIIAMTANVFKEDIDRALESGMNDHLGKPINMDDVLAMLRRYLTKQKDGSGAFGSG